MKEEGIAPCGMNCRLCVNYQMYEKDLTKKGFHREPCPGCIPRGENCTHLGNSCTLLAEGQVRFCFQCEQYPCKRLKALDKRYRNKYHMSMIENLESIRTRGLDAFLQEQEKVWQCPSCGDVICCHNGLCMNCQLDVLRQNKRYRWGEGSGD